MDLGEQVLRDIKRCVYIQDELRGEITNLRGQVALECQNLTFIKNEGAHLTLKLTNKLEAIKSFKEQLEFLDLTREALLKAYRWRSYFTKFVTNLDPKDEQVECFVNSMQSRYSALIECYEQKPEYKHIVEAETTTRQLTELIGEKRNELMKIETERDYN